MTAAPRQAGTRVLAQRPVPWSAVAGALASVLCGACGVGRGDARGTFDVTPPLPLRVVAVRLTPTDLRLVVGGRAPLQATPLDASGAAMLGRPVTWASDFPGVATVDSTGTVTGRAIGVAHISATADGITTAATTTVVPTPVSHVVVAPVPELVPGQTVPITAAVRDSLGNAVVDRQVAWASGEPRVATVSSAGTLTAVVRAVAVGAGSVTATIEGRSATVPIHVLPPPVARLELAGPSRVAVGGTVVWTATPRDVTGAALSDRLVSWSSADITVVVANASGDTQSATLTGRALGTTTVRAVIGDVVASAPVTAVPGSVQVAPDAATVLVGARLQLRATWVDARGAAAPLAQATWVSSDTSRATVTDGLVTGRSPGPAVITAVRDGVNGVATVTVVAPSTIYTMTALAGNGQTALVGARVPIAPAALVVDGSGRSVSGVPVTFAVTGGGGMVTGLSQLTNAQGVAAVGSWALGPLPGTNTLVATIRTPTGGTVTAQWTATATTATPPPTCCRVCTTGKPCGDSCISRSDTCHTVGGCACAGIVGPTSDALETLRESTGTRPRRFVALTSSPPFTTCLGQLLTLFPRLSVGWLSSGL